MDTKPQKWTLNIAPYPLELAPQAVEGIQQLEALWQRPVFFMILKLGKEPKALSDLNDHVYTAIKDRARELPKCPMILLHCRGGYAPSAFRLANLLKHACGEFDIVVPDHARSASALLCLASNVIRMGPFSELGPIDPQIFAGGELTSSLNCIEAEVSNKKLCTSLINSLRQKGHDHFSDEQAETLKATFQGMDVGRAQLLGSKSRSAIKLVLKYATQLLKSRYGERKARTISRALLYGHFDHSAPITLRELELIGLQHVTPLTSTEEKLIDEIMRALPDNNCIGSLKRWDATYKPGEPLPPRPRRYHLGEETDPAPISNKEVDA